MAKNNFFLPGFDNIEKELEISNNNHIALFVDYDDVNHYVVEELLKLIVPTLNAIPKDQWKAAVKAGQKRLKELQ